MAILRIRVPDELGRRMAELDTVDWDAVISDRLRAELDDLEGRDPARAAALSDRLSATIDPAEVEDQNTADRIREQRDRRYGPDR